jgi:hypothetical protein
LGEAVLRALGEGSLEIARSLWLAEQTVKFHLTKIYRKLDVSSRTEARALGVRARPDRGTARGRSLEVVPRCRPRAGVIAGSDGPT